MNAPAIVKLGCNAHPLYASYVHRVLRRSFRQTWMTLLYSPYDAAEEEGEIPATTFGEALATPAALAAAGLEAAREGDALTLPQIEKMAAGGVMSFRWGATDGEMTKAAFHVWLDESDGRNRALQIISTELSNLRFGKSQAPKTLPAQVMNGKPVVFSVGKEPLSDEDHYVLEFLLQVLSVCTGTDSRAVPVGPKRADGAARDMVLIPSWVGNPASDVPDVNEKRKIDPVSQELLGGFIRPETLDGFTVFETYNPNLDPVIRAAALRYGRCLTTLDNAVALAGLGKPRPSRGA